MTKENVKDFIEENKYKLALVAGAVTGIAIWLITRDKVSNYSDISLPELPTGEWVNFYRADKGKYAGGITGVVKAVDVADLGKFGEMLTTVETIDDHEPIRIIFGTERCFK